MPSNSCNFCITETSCKKKRLSLDRNNMRGTDLLVAVMNLGFHQIWLNMLKNVFYCILSINFNWLTKSLG